MEKVTRSEKEYVMKVWQFWGFLVSNIVAILLASFVIGGYVRGMEEDVKHNTESIHIVDQNLKEHVADRIDMHPSYKDQTINFLPRSEAENLLKEVKELKQEIKEFRSILMRKQ